MIIKQLKQLCILKDCFLFEGRVYEICNGPPELYEVNPKQSVYRFMISDDDYDYVEDKKLIRRLDKFVKQNKGNRKL